MLDVAAPGVLANDSDPDPGDFLRAEVVSGPAHAYSFNLTADGAYRYVPASDFNGSDSFTYVARDRFDDASGVVAVNLTVTAVNDAPVAANDTVTATVNMALSIPFGTLLAQ